MHFLKHFHPFSFVLVQCNLYIMCIVRFIRNTKLYKVGKMKNVFNDVGGTYSNQCIVKWLILTVFCLCFLLCVRGL
jgi:hypothetical protein